MFGLIFSKFDSVLDFWRRSAELLYLDIWNFVILTFQWLYKLVGESFSFFHRYDINFSAFGKLSNTWILVSFDLPMALHTHRGVGTIFWKYKINNPLFLIFSEIFSEIPRFKHMSILIIFNLLMTLHTHMRVVSIFWEIKK